MLGVDDYTREITNESGLEGIIPALETSFQSASDYSIFQGSTGSGNEAGWYGFRRTASKTSYVIMMVGSKGICQCTRNRTGVWKVYRMSSLIS